MSNPYRIAWPAHIAFSGGRTSGYLLNRILDAYDGVLPADIHVTFCNTGRELEATLRFVNECSERWGVEIHWLEFDSRIHDRTREVTFQTASRNGEPLADVVATRPTQHLFNPVSRYCSVTAKSRRMQKFMRRQGYDRWYSARGLRADEMDRVQRAYARTGIDREYPLCPLADAGVTKEHVAQFWASQPFDLELPTQNGVTPLGNCDLCMMKSKAKLINTLRAMPSAADWWVAQENRMTSIIADIPRKRRIDPATGEVLPPLPERRNRFFKDGTSYRDLLAEANHRNALGLPLDPVYDSGSDCICTD